MTPDGTNTPAQEGGAEELGVVESGSGGRTRAGEEAQPVPGSAEGRCA